MKSTSAGRFAERRTPRTSLGRGIGAWTALAMLGLGGAPVAAIPTAQAQASESHPAYAEARAHLRQLIEDGEYETAELDARALLVEVTGAEGEDSIEVARVLDRLADALWRQRSGKEDEALELARRAVEIKEAKLGPSSPEVASSLLDLANVLQAMREYQELDAIYQRALSISEAAAGPDDPTVGIVLNNWGNALNHRGDFDRAESRLLRALEIYEASVGPDSLEVAEVLGNLSTSYSSGEPAKTVELDDRALRILRSNLGPTHPSVASKHSDLGLALTETGDFVQGRDHLEASIAAWQAAGMGASTGNATAQVNLAILYSRLGDWSRAEQHFLEAIEIGTATADPFLVAAGLGNYAGVLKELGDFGGALATYEQALAQFVEIFGEEHDRIAWLESNLGELLFELGDLAAARARTERALEILDATSRDHFLAPGALQSLSAVALEEGEADEAERHLQEALEIAERLYGPDHFSVGSITRQLGQLRLETGRTASALELLERARELSSAAYGHRHLETHRALRALAAAHRAAGRSDRALELLGRTLSIQEETFEPIHPELAATRLELAHLLFDLGHTEEAFELALRAEEGSRQHLRLVARAVTEREALSYSTARVDALDLVLSIAVLEPSKYSTRAFDALIRSRALVLDEMASRRHLLHSTDDPAVVHAAEELVAVRTRLAGLIVRGVGEVPREQYEVLLAEALREREAAERDLARRSVEFRSEREMAGIGLSELTPALFERSALVAFARYDRMVPAADAGRAPSPSYVAFVVGARGGEPVAVALGDTEPIDSAIAALRSQMELAAADPIRASRSEDSYRRAGHALRRLIWDPVSPLLENASHLFVVPDGALNLVHVAAVPSTNGYLIEKHQFRYLSAERDLARRPDLEPGQGLLAVGNPAYDEPALFTSLDVDRNPSAGGEPSATSTQRAALYRSGCGELATLRFEPLPASLTELDELSSLLDEWVSNFPDDATDTGALAMTRLEGPGATEGAFKKAAAGKRVLHLATHGYFQGDACRSDPDSLPERNPLLLSGLALAGANRRSEAAQDEEDGILTAEEVAALDLSGVELVVLSACESGIGAIQTGEGVLGLRRAFRVAGARSLVMSLWTIEDEATQRWMSRFYEGRLARRLAPGRAAHEASLDALSEARAKGEPTHPFFWAGFVVEGGWR